MLDLFSINSQIQGYYPVTASQIQGYYPGTASQIQGYYPGTASLGSSKIQCLGVANRTSRINQISKVNKVSKQTSHH